METTPQGAMKFPALGDTSAVLAQAQSAELWEMAVQAWELPTLILLGGQWSGPSRDKGLFPATESKSSFEPQGDRTGPAQHFP